jgi:hypothetical protein
MTSKSSPITPPPELVQQWLCSNDYPWGPFELTSITITANRLQSIATRAAQWGADQELEACVNWLIENQNPRWAHALRAARRPKPPSLKEQALAALNVIEDKMLGPTTEEILIRKALEALPE